MDDRRSCHHDADEDELEGINVFDNSAARRITTR